jgi:hypothetical protein
VIESVYSDDPEVRARERHIVELFLAKMLDLQRELADRGIAEGRLIEARSVLRRVLARRSLALSAADEARIEACADLATLQRWHGEAVVASSAAEALRSQAPPAD